MADRRHLEVQLHSPAPHRTVHPDTALAVPQPQDFPSQAAMPVVIPERNIIATIRPLAVVAAGLEDSQELRRVLPRSSLAQFHHPDSRALSLDSRVPPRTAAARPRSPVTALLLLEALRPRFLGPSRGTVSNLRTHMVADHPPLHLGGKTGHVSKLLSSVPSVPSLRIVLLFVLSSNFFVPLLFHLKLFYLWVAPNIPLSKGSLLYVHRCFSISEQ